MRRLIGACLCLSMLGVVALASNAEGPKPNSDSKSRHFEVRMQSGNKFNPDSFEIQVGDTVTWINEDDTKHSATPDDDSPIMFTETDLASGKFSGRITFDTAGTVKYHCKHHPATMKGTITVTASK